MVSRTAVIINEAGLHLKPAARFCEEALKYKSTVTFTFGNTTANAKSVLSVLGDDGYVWGSYVGKSSGQRRYVALGTAELAS